MYVCQGNDWSDTNCLLKEEIFIFGSKSTTVLVQFSEFNDSFYLIMFNYIDNVVALVIYLHETNRNHFSICM